MNYQAVFVTLLFVIFCNVSLIFAQSQKSQDIDSKNIVITMQQEPARGFIAGLQSYVVTIFGNGTVTFDGMDEGKAISRYEPPVKVFRKYQISKTQLKELIDEFERIDFFSLDNEYCCRDNGDGSFYKGF